MQFNNKETNNSWTSPPKKKYKATNNRWQVPNFDFAALNSKEKRKSKSSRRKFDLPCTPTENVSFIISVDDLSTPSTESFDSPILNKNKHKSNYESNNLSPVIEHTINDLESQNNEVLSPILNSKVNLSPIINDKKLYSDSESDLERSPVINHRKKLIKQRKYRLNEINGSNCVRKLTKLQVDNEISNSSSKTNDIQKLNNEIIKSNNKNLGKDISPIKCNESFEIETLESQNLVKSQMVNTNIKGNRHVDGEIFRKLTSKFEATEEKNIKVIKNYQNKEKKSELTKNKIENSKIFENLAQKFETEEDVEIEIFDSQELDESVLSNQNENCIEIELINSQKEVQTEIEIINSQEVLNIETSQSIKTSEDEKCQIDSVESQKSSEITISSTGTVVPDSQERSSEEYQLSPLKKKKYKPGTLAHRFHKLIRKQKGDVAIWKHELYLTSKTNYQIPATKEDHLITTLKIRKIFADFGSNIWECEENNKEKCLVIVDSSYLDISSFKCNDKIKIIPPFYIKHLLISCVKVKTFINVHKLLKL